MAKKKAPKLTPVAVALLAAVSAAVEEGLLTTEHLVSELGLEAPEADEKPAKGKGKKAAKEEAPAKGKGAKGKGKKAVEEDDEDEDDEEEGDDAPDFGEMSLKQMKAFVKENELEVPKAVLKDEDELREWLEENYESDDSDDDEDDEDEDEDSDDDEDDEDW